MTRRDAIFKTIASVAGAGVFAGPPLAAKDFWDEKDSQDWTPQEIEQLLTRSPWAKQASISFNSGPGGVSSVPWILDGRPRGRNTPESESADDPKNFRAVVRWESSRVLRAAEKVKTLDDNGRAYIIGVIGNYPDFLRAGGNENVAAREQRLMALRESTKLERKGDGPIYLDRAESVGSGTLFYFSRLDPIKPSNREITFVTRLGPLGIKASFPLKDMMYRGQLDL